MKVFAINPTAEKTFRGEKVTLEDVVEASKHIGAQVEGVESILLNMQRAINLAASQLGWETLDSKLDDVSECLHSNLCILLSYIEQTTKEAK